MIRGDGHLDDTLILAILILLPIDLTQELDAIQIGKATDVARILCGRTVVARMDPSCRVEDRLDEGAAHIGPLGTLGAVQPDQRPHLATRILTFHHHEFAIQIY